MNKRQVLILWAVAIALGGGVATVKFSQSNATKISTDRKAGDTLFQSFPAADAATIEIRGAESSVDLTKKDGKWVVAQRAGYPANSTFVNDLIRVIGDLKITQALEAGPSFAPRFGMDESSTKDEERGLTATFKDAAGKELAKVGLGKNIENASSPSPMPGMGGGNAVGRYVRNFSDESGFYAVSEMFPSVSADPKRWLADGFINVEKIKAITVSKPNETDQAWKVSRESDEAQFKLDGAKAEEVLDNAVAESLKGIFSYARFEDVVPAEEVAAKAREHPKREVTIETVEGFTYKITLVSAEVPDEDEVPSFEPAAPVEYLVTVSVNATLPAERKKEEGEKPEDAKTKDEAFTSRKKELSDKLAKEKAFEGITFAVSKGIVEPLLKIREELIAKPAPPEADAAAGSVQQLPGGLIASPPGRPARPTPPTSPPVSVAPPPIEVTSPPIEATTPPISVPPSGEDEAPDAPEEEEGE